MDSDGSKCFPHDKPWLNPSLLIIENFTQKKNFPQMIDFLLNSL